MSLNHVYTLRLLMEFFSESVNKEIHNYIYLYVELVQCPEKEIILTE